VSRAKGARGKPRTRHAPQPVPVTVTLHGPLLEQVRATYPVARDWTDNQVAAACVALALKTGRPRTGLVHSE
jgi:hypothetical protein